MGEYDDLNLQSGDLVYASGRAIMLEEGVLELSELEEMDLRELYAAQNELKELMCNAEGRHVQRLSVLLSAVNAELMKRATVLHFGESLDE